MQRFASSQGAGDQRRTGGGSRGISASARDKDHPAFTDAWAQRRFVVCFKSFDALQPAAQRMVVYLVSRIDGQLSSDPDSKTML
jgi:hypothetical protein